MNPFHFYRLIFGSLLLALLTSCGSDSTATSNSANEAANTQKELPPGFLDEPPPGPVSATTVLSGGVLITDAAYRDAIVVVQNGTLLGWGIRGAVDMPHDSVGLDMRNRWLVPGTRAALAAGTLPDLESWQAGAPVNLLILDVDPQTSDINAANVVGSIEAGEISIPAQE